MSAISALSFDPSASTLLADAALKGVVMLGAAGLLALGLRKGTAAARHLVWSIALTILLLQPALSLLFPGWSLPVLPASPALAHATGGWAPTLPAPAVWKADAPSAPGTAPARAVASASPEPRRQAALWLLWIWLAGAVLLSLRLAVGTARALRLLREARQVGDESWEGEVRALCARLGISRPVRLLATSRELMPITWGLLRPVVVLPASALEWTAERRRAVLLHELAHVQRWDCLTQGIAQLACVLHWLNPLAWLAVGQLLAEREQACDDQVLLCGTPPSAYATHLVDIARAFGAGAPFYPASAAMARRSRLESRVRTILSFPGERGAAGVRLLVAGALAVVLILPLALLHPKPAGATPEEKAAAGDEPPTQEALRGEHLVMWDDGPVHYEVTSHGTGELTADETGVAQLSRGGYLKIAIQRPQGGGQPPVTVRSLSILERGGSLVYEQTVQGRQQPFDAASQQWLARLLPEITAETGFGAATRVSHLLRSGGVDKVLAEVGKIKNPHVKRAFLGELLHDGLSASDLRKVVRFAGRDLPPDGDVSAFLMTSADLYLKDPEDRAAFLEAAADIRSEDEYARFMAALLKSQRLAPEAQAELIRTASARFESDETRAGFLATIAESALAEEELQPVFFETLKAVKNEDLQARLAVRLLGHEGLDGDLRRRLFVASFNAMVTDETKAGFLLQTGEGSLNDPALRETYLEAAKSIREDRPRAAVQKLLREHGES